MTKIVGERKAKSRSVSDSRRPFNNTVSHACSSFMIHHHIGINTIVVWKEIY